MKTNERIFIGVYPGGLVYADRAREKHGDYARLGFLSYTTLTPQIEADCPPELRVEVWQHMDAMIRRRGEKFQISTVGQTVTLGA